MQAFIYGMQRLWVNGRSQNTPQRQEKFLEGGRIHKSRKMFERVKTLALTELTNLGLILDGRTVFASEAEEVFHHSFCHITHAPVKLRQ